MKLRYLFLASCLCISVSARAESITVLADGSTITSFDPLAASDGDLARRGLPPHGDKFWSRYNGHLKYIEPKFILGDTPISTTNAGSNKAGTETYANWSGGVVYASPGTSFQSVTGEWVTPDAHPTAEATWQYTVNWVGIDGDGSSDVLQAGVLNESFANANGTYSSLLYFWHEWVPQGLVTVANFTFRAGDLIFVNISSTGAGATSATINALNETTGAYTAYTITAPAGTSLFGNSAEWIAEAPTVNGNIVTMPDYGQIFFSGAQATQSDGSIVNGGTGNNINLAQGGVILSTGTLVSPNVIQCQYVGIVP